MHVNDILITGVSMCEFMQESVTYLGHRIDWHGLHPLKEKLQVVQEAPALKNITELKSYLGLMTYYYSKFIPNMATTLACSTPLKRRVMEMDTYWEKGISTFQNFAVTFVNREMKKYQCYLNYDKANGDVARLKWVGDSLRWWCKL